MLVLVLTGYITTKIKDVSAIWKEVLQIRFIHQIQYSLSQLALGQTSISKTAGDQCLSGARLAQ